MSHDCQVGLLEQYDPSQLAAAIRDIRTGRHAGAVPAAEVGVLVVYAPRTTIVIYCLSPCDTVHIYLIMRRFVRCWMPC